MSWLVVLSFPQAMLALWHSIPQAQTMGWRSLGWQESKGRWCREPPVCRARVDWPHIHVLSATFLQHAPLSQITDSNVWRTSTSNFPTTSLNWLRINQRYIRKERQHSVVVPTLPSDFCLAFSQPIWDLSQLLWGLNPRAEVWGLESLESSYIILVQVTQTSVSLSCVTIQCM